MVDFNKRKFVKRIVAEAGVEPDAEPAGIFMAGLPGAGKTELSRNIIADAGVSPLRIDMDEIAEMLPGYKPENADEFRKPATQILSELFSYALKHNLNFVMDGTFGSKQATPNIERSLNHGFGVKIIYAYQDPKLAWEFTLAREKVEHRAIKFDGFVEAYYKTIYNIKEVGREFGGKITIDIAFKNPDNKVGKWLRDVDAAKIDELLKIEYNKDKLIKYIKGA